MTGVRRQPWANAPFIPGSLADYMESQFLFFNSPKLSDEGRPVMAGLNYFLTHENRRSSGSGLLGEKKDVKVWLGWLERYVHGEVEAIEASYTGGVTDEFVEPVLITGADGAPLARVEDGDSVFFWNFVIFGVTQIYTATMRAAGAVWVPLAVVGIALFLIGAALLAGLYRAAVNKNSWPIEPRHGHDTARHILVAAPYRDDAIEALRASDRLDRVGDDFARNQRIAHPRRAHRYAIGDTDRIEDNSLAPGLTGGGRCLVSQAADVHIARRHHAPG